MVTSVYFVLMMGSAGWIYRRREAQARQLRTQNPERPAPVSRTSAFGTATSVTEQILLAGGVHANHPEAFNTITNQDLCPTGRK